MAEVHCWVTGQHEPRWPHATDTGARYQSAIVRITSPRNAPQDPPRHLTHVQPSDRPSWPAKQTYPCPATYWRCARDMSAHRFRDSAIARERGQTATGPPCARDGSSAARPGAALRASRWCKASARLRTPLLAEFGRCRDEFDTRGVCNRRAKLGRVPREATGRSTLRHHNSLQQKGLSNTSRPATSLCPASLGHPGARSVSPVRPCITLIETGLCTVTH